MARMAGRRWPMAAPIERLNLGQRRKESGEGRMRVPSVRPLTGGVMKALIRNGRDRRSENPSSGHAKKERVVLFGTEQGITSGPAATAAASNGRIHDRT